MRRQSTSRSETRRLYALSREGKRRLRDRQVKEQMDVLDFFFLNKGCQHVRARLYLSSGQLSDPPTGIPPCRDNCSICTGQWHKLHLPVYKSGLCEFFRWDKLPLPVDGKSSISDLIWGDSFWIERIFDRAASGVKKYNIDALFYSLAAAGIVKIEKRDRVVQWALPYEPKEDNRYIRVYNYEKNESWRGVNLYPETRPRRRGHSV